VTDRKFTPTLLFVVCLFAIIFQYMIGTENEMPFIPEVFG
jgi:hypothetical protein